MAMVFSGAGGVAFCSALNGELTDQLNEIASRAKRLAGSMGNPPGGERNRIDPLPVNVLLILARLRPDSRKSHAPAPWVHSPVNDGDWPILAAQACRETDRNCIEMAYSKGDWKWRRDSTTIPVCSMPTPSRSQKNSRGVPRLACRPQTCLP